MCGSPPPPEAFSRGFFAGARVRLGRSGRRRGSARAALHALTRGLDVGLYIGYLRNLRALPLSSFLMHRLATGMVFYRDFVGGVLSDLRSPGRRREDLCRRP